MGYVSVKGGREAIDNSISFFQTQRNDGSVDPITVEQIQKELHFLVDRVMSEASLYSPLFAAVAIKQAAGDVFEASFILRAYRSALPRIGYTAIIRTERMRLIRRISSAFKDLPGGQYLGPTSDYALRVLNLELIDECKDGARKHYENFLDKVSGLDGKLQDGCSKLIEILRKENLIVQKHSKKDDGGVFDITKNSLIFPCPRSAILQALSRGETGGLLLLAYSNVRGYGMTHPTVGELRVGYVRVEIKHPFKDKTLVIGEILITETELISKAISIDDVPKFQVGYGLCFGHNETKALSMAILDIALSGDCPNYPSEDQEFVLYHIDGIESTGFINHFKLPHYVTFLSELDRLRAMHKNFEKEL